MKADRTKVESVLSALRQGVKACEAYLLVCNEAVLPELKAKLEAVNTPLDELLLSLSPAPVAPSAPKK